MVIGRWPNFNTTVAQHRKTINKTDYKIMSG